MKRGAVIQARLDSARFPGKALAPLAGRPILSHVIARARRISLADDIVLATSDRAVDDPLAALAREEGIAVFRGSLGDVVRRTLDCALTHEFEVVARLCGDSPFLSPGFLTGLCACKKKRMPIWPRTPLCDPIPKD